VSERVRIGVLGRPYGLKGGLKLRTEAAPEVLGALDRLYLEGRGWRAVARLDWVGSEPVVYLVGVQDRSAAEPLVGTPVFALASELPALPEGSYYYFELVGRPVFLEGEPFGEVVEVLEAGAQDLLKVRRGLREYLVPLQAPYVAVEEGAIRIEGAPEGLFEES
jgi:16S rRNA processing protein RimM